MSTLIPVVLSGGSGSRLWPLSRALRPKQFLSITDEATLFQLTLQRLQGIQGEGVAMRPIVVANNDHRFLAGEQCREVGVTPLAILLEPVARNTAPAIAAAAFAALALAGDAGDDPVLLVLPSDHVFSDVPAFHRAVRVGLEAAEAGALVTFGIVPTHAETGYGYVQAREPLDASRAVPGRALSKSPICQPHKPMWTTAATPGTVACLCSRRRCSCKSWRMPMPTCTRLAKRLGSRHKKTWSLCAWTKPRLRLHHLTRWTTP